MTVQNEITRLAGAKADLKTAIEAKGVTVPEEAGLDAYPALVEQISTGIESLDESTPTTLNGILKGNGTSLGVAVVGTDYVATESDPTVPSWAKQPSKPTYTASEVGAEATGAVATHNAASDAHASLFAGKISSTEKGAASGLATLDTYVKVTAEQTSAVVVPVAGSKTLSLADAGTFQICNSTSAITITIAPSSSVAFPAATEIEFCQGNNGVVTITGGSNVLVWSKDSLFSTAGKYGVVAIKLIGPNIWLLSGELA